MTASRKAKFTRLSYWRMSQKWQVIILLYFAKPIAVDQRWHKTYFMADNHHLKKPTCSSYYCSKSSYISFFLFPPLWKQKKFTLPFLIFSYQEEGLTTISSFSTGPPSLIISPPVSLVLNHITKYGWLRKNTDRNWNQRTQQATRTSIKYYTRNDGLQPSLSES